MRLIELSQGSRVEVLDQGLYHKATVNGDPFVVGIMGIEPTKVEARIPCYIAASDRCIIAHPSNIRKVLS